ncbi:hypothetical protein [Streptomyces litchfieldiae]|uniref:DUF998 domain-containing protein n=1 Tax=Streptomyces litchfieldiae TaxID=3075543 RepID=A0ABU2MW80_9ACTN|nr:hypothetical protein [Streptomyces sp. DSM 44938]MDT0345905.1 hypothetical protein [Streptomyces sp. DSM 44938]
MLTERRSTFLLWPALAGCLLAAGWLAFEALTTDAHFVYGGPWPDVPSGMTYPFAWWPFALTLAGALLTRGLVEFGGERAGSRPLFVLGAAGATLIAVSLAVPHTYASVWSGDGTALESPLARGGIGFGAPFVVLGAVLLLARIVRPRLRLGRIGVPCGVLGVTMLLLGPPLMESAGTDGSPHIAGPAVLLATAGVALLCAALPAR